MVFIGGVVVGELKHEEQVNRMFTYYQKVSTSNFEKCFNGKVGYIGLNKDRIISTGLDFDPKIMPMATKEYNLIPCPKK